MGRLSRPKAWWWTALVAAAAAAVAATGQTVDHVIYLNYTTSSSIFVFVPCIANGTCSANDLKYKKQHESTWNTGFELVEDSTRAVYVIDRLKSDTKYEIEITATADSSARHLDVWTCPEELPSLAMMRVVKTGPGWLDVRWPPVRDEKCDSRIYYRVRYGVEATPLSKSTSYGAYSAPGSGQLTFRPSHPCAAWPGEFCLLLTDHVQPGKNHTIEVRAARYDARDGLEPPTRKVSSWTAKQFAVANSEMQSAAYTLGARDDDSPCAPLQRPVATAFPVPGSVGGSLVVPVWAIAFAALGLVAATTLALSTRCRPCRRALTKNKKDPITATLSDAGCPKSDPPASRVSNVYDDCESLRAGRVQPSLYERLRTKGGSAVGMLAAEAASRVARTPTHISEGSQYVAMGGGRLVYDDVRSAAAGDAKGEGEGVQATYENMSPDARESSVYMDIDPQGLYDDVGAGERDSNRSVRSPGYNRPYSQAKTGLWRGW